MTWTRSEVEACLGEPKDSDIAAGWARYWYKQERCSEWIMYKADGKVHTVQGYGAESECRRVVNNCISLATGKPMRDIRTIGGGDAWSYDGEVIVAGGQTCTHIPCNFYCEKGVCAHGTGHLGTDGSWWYDGSFVDGQMEGHGRYENDFYIYEGDFKNNEFDGKGLLTCLVNGPAYRGVFVNGSLNGKPIGWQGPCDE